MSFKFVFGSFISVFVGTASSLAADVLDVNGHTVVVDSQTQVFVDADQAAIECRVVYSRQTEPVPRIRPVLGTVSYTHLTLPTNREV